MSQTEAFKVYPMCKGYIHFWLVPPLHVNFNFNSMSTLANESIFETLFEETMEELEARNFQLLFSQSDMEKVAGEIAMDKFLSNNP